jgi:cysteinyl-tRNA synthetase
MTRAAFGQHLDLHAGGVDLAFPHHENEIAQWRGCNADLTGTWCKCWLHTGHLHIEGRKMSKSLKNFVTVRELLNGDDAVDPEAFRIFCGLHRYASTVSYSRVKLAEADAARRDFDAALRAARNALSGDLSRAPRRWTDRERALHEAHRGAQKTFAATLLDDANLPEALQALLDLATRLRQHCLEAATERRDVVPEPVNAAAAFLATSLRDLGLVETAGAWDGVSSSSKEDSDDGALEALVAFRGSLRKAALAAKDDDSKLKLRGSILAESDALRDAEFLVKQGLALVDTPDGETLVQPRVAEAAKPKAPKAEAPAAFDYSHTPPEELYTVGEFAGRYGSFDESGLPLTDAAGEPVSKSQRKKLKKRLDVHAKKWAGAASAA